jgi:hypothetical protein
MVLQTKKRLTRLAERPSSPSLLRGAETRAGGAGVLSGTKEAPATEIPGL